VIFWVVAPCSVVDGYRRFGRPCCLRLQILYLHLCGEDLKLSQIFLALTGKSTLGKILKENLKSR